MTESRASTFKGTIVALSKTDIDKLKSIDLDVVDQLVRQYREGVSWHDSRSQIPPLVEALAEDAKKNASGLPGFANKNQAMANRITALSSALAAATSLTIWVTLQQSPAWWAKVIVASATLGAAVLGFLPRIYGWSEAAAEARQLASQYGHLYGDLLEVEGRFLKGEIVSADRINEMRNTLENLKDRRQRINAELR